MATLRLDAEITEESANVLRAAIAAVPAEEKIELRINSPGGMIFPGQMLLHALQQHTGGVDTVIESLGASMAGVIFMAGEKRSMARGSRLMIHNPWTSMSGEAEDLRKSADLLDSLKKDLVSIFTVKSGLDTARVEELMTAESWLDADSAKTLGFATDVIGGDFKNAINAEALGKFGYLNIPEELVTKPEPTPAPVNIAEAQTLAALVPDLQANVVNLQAALKERTKQLKDAKDALAKSKTLMQALKRSYGLTAANVGPDGEFSSANVLDVPCVPSDLNPSVFEQYSKLTGEAQTTFFKQHRDELLSYINRPAPRND